MVVVQFETNCTIPKAIQERLNAIGKQNLITPDQIKIRK